MSSAYHLQSMQAMCLCLWRWRRRNGLTAACLPYFETSVVAEVAEGSRIGCNGMNPVKTDSRAFNAVLQSQV